MLNIKSLFSKGSLDNYDSNGMTELMHACSKGLLDNVIALISKGADLNIRDLNGNTAITYACTYKYNELETRRQIVDILIENGATINVNFMEKFYCTFQYDHRHMLFEKLVKLNKMNDISETYILKLLNHVNGYCISFDTFKLIVDNYKFSESRMPLGVLVSITHGCLDDKLGDQILYLIQKYRDMNFTFNDHPYLHLVCKIKCDSRHLVYKYRILKYSLKYTTYVNLDRVDTCGQTALMILVKTGGRNLIELIKLFVSRNANLNIQDKNGDTVLIHLMRTHDSRLDIIKLLVDNGAVTCMQNLRGMNAFMVYAEHCGILDTEIMEYLIDNDKSSVGINQLDYSNQSALFHSIIKSMIRIDQLIYCDNNNQFRSLNDKLPSEYIKEYNDTIRIFVKYGADFDSVDSHGKTPESYINGKFRELLNLYS